jgi:hypothetical protein
MVGDDGTASAVLRRLGQRTYGRRRGRTGGPPRARRAYGGAATRLEGVLGRGERREAWASGGARPRAEESSGRCVGHGRRGSAGAGQRRAARGRVTSRRAGAWPDTVLLLSAFEIEFLQKFE